MYWNESKEWVILISWSAKELASLEIKESDSLSSQQITSVKTSVGMIG